MCTACRASRLAPRQGTSAAGQRDSNAPLACREVRHPVDKIVGEFVEPGVFQMCGDAVASKRKAHQIDEAALLGPTLDPAAPILRRTQRVAPQRLDLVVVRFRKVVVALYGARTDVTLG